MTDLELTKLCAEAIGYLEYMPKKWWTDDDKSHFHIADNLGGLPFVYDPLHDDAQAMALVKKMGVTIQTAGDGLWAVIPSGMGDVRYCIDDARNLNRAIVECVARMQKAKK